MYARSARIYDLLYTGTRIKDYATEADVLHALIQRVHPGARTLLDVACGTGAHLAFLRERYEVAGADVSPEMLAVAREQLGDDVPLEVADMRTLHLGRRFDAVTCLFSGIGYVLDADGLRQTMRRSADHVNVGGVLIVDGWVRPDAWMDGHRPPPEYADDGTLGVVRLTHSRPEDRITTLEMHHLVRDQSGVEHFVEHHVMAMTPTAEYVAAAEAAGLGVEVEADYMPGRDRIIAVRRA